MIAGIEYLPSAMPRPIISSSRLFARSALLAAADAERFLARRTTLPLYGLPPTRGLPGIHADNFIRHGFTNIGGFHEYLYLSFRFGFDEEISPNDWPLSLHRLNFFPRAVGKSFAMLAF